MLQYREHHFWYVFKWVTGEVSWFDGGCDGNPPSDGERRRAESTFVCNAALLS